MRVLHKSDYPYLIGCIVAIMLISFSTCNRAYCQEGQTASEIYQIENENRLFYDGGKSVFDTSRVVQLDGDYSWWRDTVLIIDSETGWLDFRTSPPPKECPPHMFTLMSDPPRCEKCWAWADSGELYIDVTTPNSPKVWIGDCINLIDLIEYETECFNDSTQVTYLYYPPPGTSPLGYTYASYTPPVMKHEWRHREPTFQGFIRWLKNR